MERKSNITTWQLGLFDAFDRDVMVMQRDEEEVFDEAIHVFLEKEYYDAYVAKAAKYSKHRYAYHEDKMGEVIYQVFDEQIPGMVIHMQAQAEVAKNVLFEERYLSEEDLRQVADIADSYHMMFAAATERKTKEEVIASLWSKDVFIIGNLPPMQKPANPEQKITFELMTMKRKREDETEYEALKVFLTGQSAMKFNPDKKPVNKYKLGMLSQFVRGRLQVIIEPHRNYFLEFDPTQIDAKAMFTGELWTADRVKARVVEYAQMDKVYVLLAASHSDYKSNLGLPYAMRVDGQGVGLMLFEKYEDAVNYTVQNPMVLPIIDGVYPVGVLEKGNQYSSFEKFLCIAKHLNVTGVNFDMDTPKAIGCKVDYLIETLGYTVDCPEEQKQFYPIPFVNQEKPYVISEERKNEILKHVKEDFDNGVSYLAGDATISEMILAMQAATLDFDAARQAKDEAKVKSCNLLMNKLSLILTDALCDKPIIFTLRDEQGEIYTKDELAYIIITNRYESSRSGEGKLAPASVENLAFLEQLAQKSQVVVVTDGPNVMCLLDIRLIIEIVKQRKMEEALREEMLIYMTQGCDMSFAEAKRYYNRIKTDREIFKELTVSMRNGQYSKAGIEVAGYTAETLATEKGLSLVEAYDMLLGLKGDPSAAKKQTAVKAAVKTEEASAETEEKKGFFGKLFKK
ncbi:MAG: hypothetical protein IJ326_09355 [Lachnospiraceae bacterium]|nr:hypothetical protein [Lachnospiraceae bacterium]